MEGVKPPTKILILALALALGLPLVGWVGTSLYWHVRITGALQTLEACVPDAAGETRPSQEAQDTLMSAGCRSLPYLVGALESSRSDTCIETVEFQIAWHVAPLGSPNRDADYDDIVKFFNDHPFAATDSPDVRRRNHECLRTWWTQTGVKHHQGWRIWSSQCPVDPR